MSGSRPAPWCHSPASLVRHLGAPLLAAYLVSFAPHAQQAPVLFQRAPNADPLARATGTAFRVVVWNVFGSGEKKPWGTVAGILRALEADVLLLSEVTVTSADRVIAWLPHAARDALRRGGSG